MTNFNDTSYTITETADKLNLSEKTLRRWEDAGRFTPTRTVGNQRRYTMEDLQILDAIKHNVIPHQKDLLTINTAAQFLGVTEATIDRLVAEGKLHPFITVGTTYYPRHRLLPLLDNLKDEPPMQSTPHVIPPTITINSDKPPAHAQPTQPHNFASSIPTPNPTTSLTYPTHLPTRSIKPYLINLLLTLTVLTTYHLLVNQTKIPNTPTTPTGSVQGAATNPSLQLLDDMLDPSTGGLTATTVISKLGTTTPNLTLLPGIAPMSPLPGSLYYDASENVLKIYSTNGWQVLTTNEQLQSLQFDLESKLATPSNTSQLN